MSDYTALAADYVAVWNETDSAKRTAMIEKLFTAGVEYRDPVMQGDGRTGVEELIAGVHERYPGYRFTLKGEANGFGDRLRFSWGMFGPDDVEAPVEGTDFIELADGRMARVTGFLDKVPAQ